MTQKKLITNPGYTGILVDGVEVLNYKSKDFVYSWNFRICKCSERWRGILILLIHQLLQ